MLGAMDDATTPRPADAATEPAVLDDGPAAGLRLRITGRPAILQVTRACEREQAPGETAEREFGVTEVYVYRRDWRVKSPPLRYGYDPASP
ncbi:hypothetical protein ABZ203_06790 [Streptomyces albidoflavus]|uniref:hypothetical protein n=1 Tax=Streptomyces TaxID=1883 RepID=UPI0004C9F5AA|nr:MULTISPECIES: hypothetical protein [Streptomyces]MBL0778050.1 hypothetical protein [Streptomyces albidoflavus]MBL0799643.1 hypothetical protein [Streptomyces albidoflavus]MBV1953455.1 hypothetical protein [Streptomyces sp. BV333]